MVVPKCPKLILNHSGIISRAYFSPFQGVYYLYRGPRRALKSYFGLILEFWIIFLIFFKIINSIEYLDSIGWIFFWMNIPDIILNWIIFRPDSMKKGIFKTDWPGPPVQAPVGTPCPQPPRTPPCSPPGEKDKSFVLIASSQKHRKNSTKTLRWYHITNITHNEVFVYLFALPERDWFALSGKPIITVLLVVTGLNLRTCILQNSNVMKVTLCEMS